MTEENIQRLLAHIEGMLRTPGVTVTEKMGHREGDPDGGCRTFEWDGVKTISVTTEKNV